VFQVLPLTLGVGPKVWRMLAKCHDLRNVGEYEGDIMPRPLTEKEYIATKLLERARKPRVREIEMTR